VVYEPRERDPVSSGLPTGDTEERYERMRALWKTIRRAEDAHQVQLCRELESGFASAVFHWAEGKPLEDLLDETGMAPGDFVRNCKQLLDVLRQVEDVAPDGTRGGVGDARRAVLRGVVAYTGVEATAPGTMPAR
jgi:ATP-dependent RNA helicase HelY